MIGHYFIFDHQQISDSYITWLNLQNKYGTFDFYTLKEKTYNFPDIVISAIAADLFFYDLGVTKNERELGLLSQSSPISGTLLYSVEVLCASSFLVDVN